MPPEGADYQRVQHVTGDAGWRAVIAARPHSATLALRCAVAAGSRYDGSAPGLAHLAERLVYRVGGPERVDLIAQLEALGAEVDSRTTREFASFHAVVAAPFARVLLELLPELLRPPALDERAVQAQQAAICDELAAPTPAGPALWDLLLEALWGDDPFARTPTGLPTSVLALEPAQVAAHHAARFGPPQTMFALAGACAAADVRAALARLPEPSRRHAPAVVYDPPMPMPPRALHRPTDQAVSHIAVGVAAPGMRHADRSGLRLLDYVLGRGGSSRLYREIRERRALAYTCASLYMPYADVGVLAAQAVCAPTAARDVARVLRECLLEVVDTPPTPEEVRAAQHRHAGALHRAFEPNVHLAQLLAIETLVAEWEPFEAAVERVHATSVDEVASVAARYLQPERLVQASLGPVDPRDG
jgi:predicted Zn-dependent peptidase